MVVPVTGLKNVDPVLLFPGLLLSRQLPLLLPPAPITELPLLLLLLLLTLLLLLVEELEEEKEEKEEELSPALKELRSSAVTDIIPEWTGSICCAPDRSIRIRAFHF